METALTAWTDVWTSDEQKLGVARAWHHRPADEIEPQYQLYAKYLEVESFELGDSFFVPSEYVVVEDGGVWVDATMKQVLNRTWSRLPDFVYRKTGRIERLPDEAATAA